MAGGWHLQFFISLPFLSGYGGGVNIMSYKQIFVDLGTSCKQSWWWCIATYTKTQYDNLVKDSFTLKKIVTFILIFKPAFFIGSSSFSRLYLFSGSPSFWRSSLFLGSSSFLGLPKFTSHLDFCNEVSMKMMAQNLFSQSIFYGEWMCGCVLICNYSFLQEPIDWVLWILLDKFNLHSICR